MVYGREPVMGAIRPVVGKHDPPAEFVSSEKQAIQRPAVIAHLDPDDLVDGIAPAKSEFQSFVV